jgi:hypothetical protein
MIVEAIRWVLEIPVSEERIAAIRLFAALCFVAALTLILQEIDEDRRL